MRVRCSILPLKFERNCFLTSKLRFFGPKLHAAGSNLAVCLRAGPELLGLLLGTVA